MLLLAFLWMFGRNGQNPESVLERLEIVGSEAETDKENLGETAEDEAEGEDAAVKEDSKESAREDTGESVSQDTGMERLQETLENMTDQADGTWSIFVKDLNSQEEISINNQEIYAASLIKLFVMESVFSYMDELIENDRQFSGSAEASYEKIIETCTAMIVESDNEAYNELVRLHDEEEDFSEGCRFIENHLLESAYIHTGIFHTLSPSDTEYESIADSSNHTSPEDCGRLLERIYEGTCVSEEASQEMLELLLQQEVVNKIPAGLPTGILAANKTGETQEVQHDAAIVFGEKTDYILCVMSSELEASDEAVELIQEISSVVYSVLNEQ